MASVSRQQRLINFLAHHDHQRARQTTIVEALAPRWMTAEQAALTIDRACAATNCNVTHSPGRSVTYWGTEIGSHIALYDSVERIITSYWGKRVSGLRRIHSELPKSGHGTGEGSWTRPDLMLFADPRRRKSIHDPRETHSLEIEKRNGFDVRSIYQAYEQGRGANYRWVFAHHDDIDSRITLAADDLGVGIVIFNNPAAYGTYKTVRHARRRSAKPAEREHFLARCGVPDYG